MYSHHDLVKISAKWVKNVLKFPVVVTELKCNGSREIPDVLAFRAHSSLIVECKTSMSDFRKDFKKPERVGEKLGIGNYRLYCAPKGLINIENIPQSWGFLEVDLKGKVSLEKFKHGNLYSSNNSPRFITDKDDFFHFSDIEKERAFLYSILIRRNFNA